MRKRTGPPSKRRSRTVDLLDRRHHGEAGFSIIEAIIAMAIFAVIASFMAQTLAGGMRGVLGGKRREVATQEASRTLEIARSVSYSAIGLDAADATVATDSQIQTQSGVKKYLAGATWEPIVFSTSGNNPFNPHTLNATRGSTQLTRFVYVTGVDTNADGAIDLKRVTVKVTWVNSGSSGPKNEVRAQTLLNQNGVVSNGDGATNPDLTPMNMDSFISGGTATVKSAIGTVSGLVNAALPSIPVTLALPTSTGASTFRAVNTTNCTAKSTTLTGSGATVYGGHSVSVTADDDAQTTTPSNPAAQSYSGSPPDSVGGVDDISNLLLQATLASPVACQATAEDADGAAPTDDSLPYEVGTGTALGTVDLVQSLVGLGLGLPSTSLTAFSAVTGPASQSIDDQTVSGSHEALASASGSLGMVNILKIPGVFADGLVRIDAVSFGSTVRGAQGTPSAAPTVTAPVINFRIYDVTNALPGCTSRTGGYCVMSVDPSAAGFSGLSRDLSNTVTIGLTKLIYDIHVNVFAPTKDGIVGTIGPNGEKRWNAQYSPITVSAELKLDLTVPLVGHVIMSDTTADVNLGSVKTSACAGAACPD